ncbi:hypothetical protein ACI0FM_07820 [Paenochrobactrum sp. BZR 588]|uniref:hypothetical protein n=1 Tax=unclassified Paenochrobactrum TaxID=2639760 RepID=UPI003855416D
MTQKTKGSAEAATSKPSQIEIPCSKKEFNMQTNTTRSQRDQVMGMEDPICDMESAVSIMNRLLQDNFTVLPTKVTGNPDYWHLTQRDVSDMFFAAALISTYSDQIKTHWQSACEAAQ